MNKRKRNVGCVCSVLSLSLKVKGKVKDIQNVGGGGGAVLVMYNAYLHPTCQSLFILVIVKFQTRRKYGIKVFFPMMEMPSVKGHHLKLLIYVLYYALSIKVKCIFHLQV